MPASEHERLDPSAVFDCLVIAHGLQKLSGSFSPAEVHLFAYLSCLLSLYKGNPVSEWGYDFVGTEMGAPYSYEIDVAIRQMEEGGLLERLDERFTVSLFASERLGELRELEFFVPRHACHEAALASAIAYSVGIVGTALGEEPDLKRARTLPAARRLLEHAALSTLYAQFEVLRRTLQDAPTSDLRVPAVVWLEALYRLQSSVLE